MYDMTRDAILTCAQKLTLVSLFYCTEPKTKKWKIEELKSKKRICSKVSVNSLGNLWSQSSPCAHYLTIGETYMHQEVAATLTVSLVR